MGPPVGADLRGRESTFCKGVLLGGALLATWDPQEGQILQRICPRYSLCSFMGENLSGQAAGSLGVVPE